MNRHRWLSFVKFKKIRGIESLIFGLILLFLPVNLAKHFFFDFAYVDGILVDYLTPTVYLTDILILTLLFFWGLRSLHFHTSKRGSIGSLRFMPFLLFLLVSALSVWGAINQPAAVYKWLKLTEYVFFSFYVSQSIDLKSDWPMIIKLLSLGVLFESALATAQWFNQGSIFGYWFLGENKYTISTPGIATFDFFGVKKVRPYGTLPHPNVLGGYLAILLPWVFYEIVSKSQISNPKSQNYSSKLKALNMISFVVGLGALYLSFSRSAWVVGALGLLSTVGLVLKPAVFAFVLFNSISFIRRAELNWIALQMIKDHPLLGVGLNNFTVRMDGYGRVSGWVRFLQPVHNVYLLVAAEIGLIGLGLFLGLLFYAFFFLWRTKRYLLLISLTQIMLLGLFDHYFWTIQQASLLFWLVVGLVYNRSQI